MVVVPRAKAERVGFRREWGDPAVITDHDRDVSEETEVPELSVALWDRADDGAGAGGGAGAGAAAAAVVSSPDDVDAVPFLLRVCLGGIPRH